MILHTISIEHAKKYETWSQDTPKVRKSSARVSKSEAKGTKSEPKGTKSEPKGSQSEPKGRQKEPKGSQREPKGGQGVPKGSQRWANGRPKCIKKSTVGKGREKGAKKDPPIYPVLILLGAFWEQLSIKNRWKNRCENRCRKSEGILRKMMRTQTYIFMIFGIAFH